MHTRYYRLLHFFVQTVNAGSFKLSAEQLHVSAPVVTQAINDLETGLGVKLLQLTTRSFSVTEIGQSVYKEALVMMQSAESVVSLLEDKEKNISGKLEVTLPTELAMYWLPKKLNNFNQLYPDVKITINSDDEAIEISKSNCEIAFRLKYFPEEHLSDSIQFEENASIIPVVLVARPSKLKTYQNLIKRGKPIPFISFTERIGNTSITAKKNNQLTQLPTSIVTAVDNNTIAKQLCSQGIGGALILKSSMNTGDAEDKLVPVLKDHTFGFTKLRVIFRDPIPRYLARVFADFMIKTDTNEQ